MSRLFRSISSLSAWVVQPVLVALILIVGFVAASQLSLRREPPQRSKTAVYAPLVRAITVERSAHPVLVRGTGTLEARTRIELVPQVGGEIIAIHRGLRSGGRFGAGEVLVSIEPRDYELAVARAEATSASAATNIVTTRAESEVAIAEWEQVNPGVPCPPLVRLEPQLLDAEASVRNAEAQLEQARLDLARTRLVLPYDGRVVEASVDVGEVVARGQTLGVVYATEVFEVAVPLRVEELVSLDLPLGAEDALGSSALVQGAGAGGPLEVTGHIARVYGELDSTSRFARVVVEIHTAQLDPVMALRLLPGTFVDVELQGRTIDDVVELPRGAIREGGLAWVIDDGKLRFTRPTIVYQANGSVFVKGLQSGARVVTSNLDVVTDGMQVRLDEEAAQ